MDFHCSQGRYDETRTTLPRIIHIYAGLRHCLMYLNDLLILRELKGPQGSVCCCIEFVLRYCLHSLTCLSHLIPLNLT
jgi:hypothetical protein